MAIELSTAGVQLKYAVEGTGGQRPTTGYTAISGIKSIPDLNPEPATHQTTDLDQLEYHTSIAGLKDVGGAMAFGANNTEAFHTAWGSLVLAATSGLSSEKHTWFEVAIPGLSKSFFFRGEPTPLGLSAIDVDAVLEIDAYIVPTKVAGWDTASS